MTLQLFGSRNKRFLKDVEPILQSIKSASVSMGLLSDDALLAMTQTFKQRLASGVSLDALLPEAFAVVQEASARTLKMRHFDEQLIGGIVLHQGKITEMGTGEGKTLMATLAAYLNALTGRGVHVVTVNAYLAERDEAWMRPVYAALGLTTGVILPDLTFEARQVAYAADITYGTNNEVGFDYLRDNMAHSTDQQVQRGCAFAIVDEVDSVLIDEARTPLVISGEVKEDLTRYPIINTLALVLTVDQDFVIDEKERTVLLTEVGHQAAESALKSHQLLVSGGLYDIENIRLLHTLSTVLRAQHCFQRDVHYIVDAECVVIIDEHTGRSMPGRRWSDGLHQAIEAKEGVCVQSENRTLASITFQNYFRMYEKLSGMTGTADTEAYEFQEIYGLEVIVIPTHKPMIREDASDRMFLTQAEKYEAIVKVLISHHEKQQPVLVGTASIESSEHLAKLLEDAGIQHAVLNAKNHEQEASIIAQAGCLGAVTIATNMAGRGTDIVLGGSQDQATCSEQWMSDHQAVLALGGLHVLGTERNESRRIDNQLRGRAGRQGDPGSSQFYLALADNLMRIFAGPKVSELMKSLMKPGETLEHPMLTRQIEGAQRRVEGFNFDLRKQLLRFDDVANEQRQLVYQQRQILLESKSIQSNIQRILISVVSCLTALYLPSTDLDAQWDISEFVSVLRAEFGLLCPIDQWQVETPELTRQEIQDRILEAVRARYAEQVNHLSSFNFNAFEKGLMLETIDRHWHDHLMLMDQLREGIHLRGYAQKNPTEEYKRESFELFEQMLLQIKRSVLSVLLCVQAPEGDLVPQLSISEGVAVHPILDASASGLIPVVDIFQDQQAGEAVNIVGRNAPCPCGSGKKYKRCHGML